MPARSKRPPRSTYDASDHPIAWFSALLRGVDRDDQRLIGEALTNLQRLGFSVVPMSRRSPAKDGAN
jgi:hypothetical protein